MLALVVAVLLNLLSSVPLPPAIYSSSTFTFDACLVIKRVPLLFWLDSQSTALLTLLSGAEHNGLSVDLFRNGGRWLQPGQQAERAVVHRIRL